MSKNYNVAILGATGAVGTELLALLEERNFPLGNLKLLASERSAGQSIKFAGKELIIESVTESSFDDVDIVIHGVAHLEEECVRYLKGILNV